MANLELNQIFKIFEESKTPALKNINLKVLDGTFTTILGPSGCGKSTLLRIVAGLENPTQGEIKIDNQVVNEIPPSERDIAMVFQNYALYPHMTVYDNIGIGLKLRGYRKEKIKEQVLKVTRKLKIDTLLERYPKQLSGGQQQRVALARALVRNPKIFLLDEPLSNLDTQIREQTRTELKRLFSSLKATALYVTHDQIEAMTLSDMMVVMKAGEIMQIGTPEEVFKNPQNKFVAEFVGIHRTNIVEGFIEKSKFFSNEKSIQIPVNLNYEGKAFLGIRPEHFSLEKNKGCIELTGSVIGVELLGAEKIIFIRIGQNELKVLVPSEKSYSIGEKISTYISPSNLLFFDQSEKSL